MKKNILLILNGTLTPPHVVDAAITIAKKSSSILHAFFIDYTIDLAEYNYPFPNDLSLTRNTLTGKTIAEENVELLKSQVTLFIDECQAEAVDFYIETEQNISLGDLIHYSAYADIILADAHENLREHHITNLLVNAHCPIYLLSKDVKQTEHVILMYDGSLSSMYAIKMYTYLLPELRDLPTYLVHIHSDKNAVLPEEGSIKKWLPAHYSNFEINLLTGKTAEVLVDFTKSFPNSLAVMGSFGRSSFARFFHSSLAKAVISKGDSSVFIAHQ